MSAVLNKVLPNLIEAVSSLICNWQFSLSLLGCDFIQANEN